MIINPDTYVDDAEGVILRLSQNAHDPKNRGVRLVTTSQLRNLLAMTADIYNEVVGLREDKLPQRVLERIEYLRLRFVYESGREKSVKTFVQEAKLVEALREIKGDKQRFIQFSRYMEALVAYRKFHVGND